MTIFKRSNSPNLWIRFRLDGVDYARSSGTTDPAIARAAEARWRVGLADQASAPATPSAMTLGEAAVRYAAEVLSAKRHVLKRTLASAESRLAMLVEQLGPDLPLSNINGDVIATYRAQLLRRKLMPASVNRTMAVLRAILNRACQEWGVLASVPRIKRLDAHDERDRVLETDEEARLLAVATPDLADFILFALDVGCRKSEGLQVAWSNIDLGEHPAVTITTAKARRTLRRRVPLTSRLVAMLTRRREADPRTVWPWTIDGQSVRGRKGKAGRRVSRSTLAKPHGVYRNGRGWDARIKQQGKLRHLGWFTDRTRAIEARMQAEIELFGDGSDASLERQWERAVEAAGLTNIYVHDMRHTFCSRLARRGTSLGIIAELAGHQDPRVTRRYTHHRPGDLDDAIRHALEG